MNPITQVATTMVKHFKKWCLYDKDRAWAASFWLSGYESTHSKGDELLGPQVGKILSRRKWQNPLQCSGLGDAHGQRSLRATAHGVTVSDTDRATENTHTPVFSQTPSCPPSPALLMSGAYLGACLWTPRIPQHSLRTTTVAGSLLHDCVSIPMTRWELFSSMTWLPITICLITQFSRNQEKLRKCLWIHRWKSFS